MLLCDPCSTVALAERVVRAVEHASGGRVPVTAKMRLGWSSDSIVAPELARALERVGIQLVTVHGRTTEQMFKGQASRAGIRRVVEAVESIPVIGNGDITEPQHALEMMRDTGCAGVMIARGALSAPWIFREAWELQKAQSSNSQTSNGDRPGLGCSDLSIENLSFELSSRLAVIRRYLDLMLEFRDEHYAMNHIRRRIAWFGKRLGPCKPLRERVRTAANPGEVRAALDEFEAGGLRRFDGIDATALLVNDTLGAD
jgi:tRNA-dihydrouridine synthase